MKDEDGRMKPVFRVASPSSFILHPPSFPLKLLDRYVLRSFLEPFFICFFGFIAVWLVFDLADNGQDFAEAKASLKAVGYYYLTQLPQTVVISLPIGMLLGLLYSLSRMSRSNELISMLGAGRSVPRLLLPLILAGLVATAVCAALNYQLAPRAEAVRKQALEQISRGRRAGEIEAVRGHLFRDRREDRMWFAERYTPGSLQLDGVQVAQQDAAGRVEKKWYARRAVFDPRTKAWTLSRGIAVEFDEHGEIVKTDDFQTGQREITDWQETPWRIGSTRLDAQGLTVPELQEFLRFNGDFPAPQLAPYRATLSDRWALPWTCLIVIFVAAPLGIVFSRRGVLAGVASSLFIFFGMIIIRYLFLALGKGNRIDPVLAPWIPNVFFLAVGLVLLYFRATNRDFPKFGFRKSR
jgi:lipopolysaccharide export system permease protein